MHPEHCADPRPPDGIRHRALRAGAAVLLLGACAGTRRPASVVPQPSADALSEIANAALTADARLESADSLYLPGAAIVAEGSRRTSVPRFAGVEGGGQVVVGSIRVDMGGDAAWAIVEYRWLASGKNIIREGRASLVFARSRDRSRWLIVHAHSSLVH